MLAMVFRECCYHLHLKVTSGMSTWRDKGRDDGEGAKDEDEGARDNEEWTRDDSEGVRDEGKGARDDGERMR